MIDSTNPRIMANNIRELAATSGGGGTNVVANPEGAATSDLEKLGVNGTIYGIPSYIPPEYSTTEFDTGKKWLGNVVYGKIITFESTLLISYNSFTDTGSTISGAEFPLIAWSYSSTGTLSPLLAYFDNGKLMVQTPRNGADAGVEWIYIEYIKTAPAQTTKSTKKK